mmetsp:Transcript_12349/g.25613  ORF Transcript_12349/g.25613 Transcript_12349/m.25613 type:complete len:258 (-) Transcript_12349:242-1015(-)
MSMNGSIGKGGNGFRRRLAVGFQARWFQRHGGRSRVRGFLCRNRFGQKGGHDGNGRHHHHAFLFFRDGGQIVTGFGGCGRIAVSGFDRSCPTRTGISITHHDRPIGHLFKIGIQIDLGSGFHYHILLVLRSGMIIAIIVPFATRQALQQTASLFLLGRIIPTGTGHLTAGPTGQTARGGSHTVIVIVTNTLTTAIGTRTIATAATDFFDGTAAQTTKKILTAAAATGTITGGIHTLHWLRHCGVCCSRSHGRDDMSL